MGKKQVKKYSEAAESAEGTRQKVKNLGEDHGVPPSEGLVGHVQVSLNLPFLFAGGRDHVPFFLRSRPYRLRFEGIALN